MAKIDKDFKTGKSTTRGTPLYMVKQRKELVKKQEKKQLQLRMVLKTNETIQNNNEDKKLIDSLKIANEVVSEHQKVKEDYVETMQEHAELMETNKDLEEEAMDVLRDVNGAEEEEDEDLMAELEEMTAVPNLNVNTNTQNDIDMDELAILNDIGGVNTQPNV